MNYTERAEKIRTQLEHFSQDGTEMHQWSRMTARSMCEFAELVVEMAREVDTKLAALPQTPETFAQHGVRRDERNPFGY